MPDDVHQTLKERAARERTTLSDMLLVEIERLARMPTWEEMRERLESRSVVDAVNVDRLIREDRDSR
ncbi:hypothetical protein [Paraconexibacter sp. AEG42_29]|uniref:hypothetical protein n=1 Tax=Paraconexibacter sp. AEG42_29 TaxID=2997339 RepID=UPI00339D619C